MPSSSILIESDLKPLYANLKRLKIGNYLYSKEFKLYMIETDQDEFWLTCVEESTKDKRVFIAGRHNIEEDEQAFLFLISAYYRNDRKEFFEVLTEILLDFAEWHPTKIDFSSICDNLKDLKFTEKKILDFNYEVKMIARKKPKVIKTKEDIKSNTPPKELTNKIFVVHGWDEVSRLELYQILKDEFKLEPVVLQDQPNKSVETIISKFERLAEDCSAAIILFTPDDKANENMRTRQNVIFELGWFLGKFHKETERKIIILKKGQVEIPSDISGVLYLEYQKKIKEIYLDLKKQFAHWGYKF